MASGLHFFYPYFLTFTKNKTVITGLKEDSSAMASGLQPGDVLTMVDGFDVLQHPAAQVSPSPPPTIHQRETREQEQEQESKVMACIGHTTKTRKSKQIEGRGCTGQKIAANV